MLGFKIATPFLFFLAVLIAAVFRVTNFHLIEFKGDEAINLYLAAQPLFGNPIPYGGTVSSIGILNPPIFNYILFPFTLLSLDPKVIVFLIGLLNSFAIAILFLIIKRFYNMNIAFIATSLLALSPWGIIYSRKIWPQDFILPLLVPLFYSIHKIIKENDSRFWTLYIISSLFLMQLHQSGLFFVPLLTIFILLKKVRINIKSVLIGIIIGIIPFLPYLSFEISNKCPDCQAYFLAKEKLGGRSLDTFKRPFQITSQGDFHFLLYDDMQTFANNFPLAYNLRRFFYLEYLLLPFGLLLFLLKKKELRSLVFITISLPILYFILNLVPHMHYYIVLTPFIFLFLGFAFSFLIFNKNKLIKFFSLLIFLGIIITSVIFNTSFFKLLDQKKTLKGDYGTTFFVTEKKARELLKNYEKDPYYQEMLLATYIPKDALYGTRPIGKMLYPYEETKKRLNDLEQRLKDVPIDSRVQNELIAFYTNSSPTEETIKLLKEKSKAIEGYRVIYEQILKLYVEEKGRR